MTIQPGHLHTPTTLAVKFIGSVEEVMRRATGPSLLGGQDFANDLLSLGCEIEQVSPVPVGTSLEQQSRVLWPARDGNGF